MNIKKIIFIQLILLLNWGEGYAQKISLSSLEDSLVNVLKAYDFYVSDLNTRRPEVIILDLPTDAGPEGGLAYANNYFSEKEAKALYRNNFEQLSKLNKILLDKQREIEEALRSENLHRMFEPVGYRTAERTLEDYVFYFIDPRICLKPSLVNKDILSYSGCKDRFKLLIQDSLFAIRNDVKSYIYSDNYNTKNLDSKDVPVALKYLLEQSLKYAKDCLAPSDYSKVKKTKLFYSNPRKDSTMLWMSSNNDSIFASPFLIRAAFFYTLNQYTLFKHLLNRYNTIRVESEGRFGPSPESEFIRRNSPEIEEGIRGFYRDFVANFSFVIAHELAHIYNDDPIGVQSEIRSDCYALRSLRTRSKKVNLGIFQSILKDAIDRNLEGAWGVSDLKTLKKRFLFIKAYLENEIDCSNIDFESLSD